MLPIVSGMNYVAFVSLIFAVMYIIGRHGRLAGRLFGDFTVLSCCATTLSVTLTFLYFYSDIAQRLPVISDPSYLIEVHREMVSVSAWANTGLKASVQFAWAMLLRQLSQYPLAGGRT